MRNKNDPKPNPKQLLYLGNKLSRKGKTPTSIETLGQFLEEEGYKVFKASSFQNQSLRLLDMLYAVLKYRNKAGVILIDTYSTLGFWFAYGSARLANKLNIEYVPILRGGDLPKRLKSHPQFCQRLFGNAKVNVAPSAYLLQEFKNAGYTNLTYIPNTIKLDLYTFEKRQELQPHLLWVRSFAHLYNPLLALKVLKELRLLYPKVKLSMVGPFKDDSIEECKAFAKENELPVTFTGGMKKQDWLQYAQDFDVFINTTNVDNTPVSVIEAMALGLPVVSTNVGGLPYLLDHEKEALLVSPGHVDEFTQAIIRLLEDPSLAQQLSLQGRKKVEHFDWEVVKHQWFEVISGES
jgi:glycosyltransferase involved in cell wall biosynthesis